MRLRPSPLIKIAINRKIDIDESVIIDLYKLIENPGLHPLKNLVAVIYYNLKRNDYLKRFPRDLTARLKEEYYNVLRLDMQQRGWLESFIEKRLFKDSKIILLKGSANWGTIYSLEAPRGGVDIDILVMERDFERITKIMEEEGSKIILDNKRVFTNRLSYEYGYSIKGLPVTVEIHRRISYPFVGDVDHKTLFASSIMHPYYRDRRVRILNPYNRLMHTLIHSLKHASITAHEIVDSYLIVRRYRLNMEDILIYAARFGVRDYAILFFKWVSELIDDERLRYSLKGRDELILKRICFALLHLKNGVFSNRIRQMISLTMMDRKTDLIRFLLFYMRLRLWDVALYRFPLLERSLYGK